MMLAMQVTKKKSIKTTTKLTIAYLDLTRMIIVVSGLDKLVVIGGMIIVVVITEHVIGGTIVIVLVESHGGRVVHGARERRCLVRSFRS